MYHVLITGFTSVFLYLISCLLCSAGYYPLQVHKKLWNTILAIVFFMTATAGIFLALQINYKWNVPFIKTILKWHVESGIGMAFTGFFHFIWHAGYYVKPQEKSNDDKKIQKPGNRTISEISTDLFMTGFIGSSFQFLLMRELMNITGGYELTSGIFLASWLTGSSIGALISGKSSLNDPGKIILFFVLSPAVSLLLMLLLSRMLLNPGETPSFLVTILFTFLIVIPFCFVSGFTFIKLLLIARANKYFESGQSFALETAGGIIAGISVTLLTSGFIGTYMLLTIILAAAVSYSVITSYINSSKVRLFVILLTAGIVLCISVLNPDLLFRQILLPGVEVVSTKDTPYGNITIGRYQGEESLFYNHRLTSFSKDVVEREENIHYAMLQCENPEKVIIISGSLRSHLPEILKYHLKSITYIERDQALAEAESEAAEVLPGNVDILNADPYRYIGDLQETVDAIILLIPPPSTLLLNRYYTLEFFRRIKQRLKPGGIFLCSPGPGNTYINKESLNLYSSIFNSLSAVFRVVRPVIGNKTYYIASDKPISLLFCQLAEMRNIKNIYVSSDFLDESNILRKSQEAEDLIDKSMDRNQAAFPVACFHSQAFQLSKSKNGKIPALFFLIIMFALPVTSVKRRNLIMFLCASALAGFEIILLLTLQLMIGNMYKMTSLVIAAIMAGLAVGSGIKCLFFNNVPIKVKVFILLMIYFFFGILYDRISEISNIYITLVIILSSGFIPAILTGSLFRELTRGYDENEVSNIYSVDLAGSAVGFLAISVIAVPVVGINISIYLLSASVFVGIIFGTK